MTEPTSRWTATSQTEWRAREPSPVLAPGSSHGPSLEDGDADQGAFVVVANRLPVRQDRGGTGLKWETSPGGLVSALSPLLRTRASTWIGWSGSAGLAPSPFQHERIHNYPIGLSRREVSDYYDGFSNGTLWPLYHDALRSPEFRREWWEPYVTVNHRFAEAAARVVARSGLVWVHDYHLQLVPGMLRALRPDVRIGFFLHIPLPPRELFARLPWRVPIVEGLLGADVVGFQTAGSAENFARLAREFGGATGSSEQLWVGQRSVRVRAIPISVDASEFERRGRLESTSRRVAYLKNRLGSERKIILGIDRMDYTKGLDIRLRAYQELLRDGRARLDDCVLVQVAVPSRERVGDYREIRAQVERFVGEINGQFGQLGRTPIHYLHRSLPMEELVALYRAADVMLVTPLRDGMNLVAKEFVATRTDERGVLVLSEFTGAAEELDAAVIVNPYDVDGVVSALERALRMEPEEKGRRMRALREEVCAHDVFDWAHSFLSALVP